MVTSQHRKLTKRLCMISGTGEPHHEPARTAQMAEHSDGNGKIRDSVKVFFVPM